MLKMGETGREGAALSSMVWVRRRCSSCAVVGVGAVVGGGGGGFGGSGGGHDAGVRSDSGIVVGFGVGSGGISVGVGGGDNPLGSSGATAMPCGRLA